jgi:hypothetical protein
MINNHVLLFTWVTWVAELAEVPGVAELAEASEAAEVSFPSAAKVVFLLRHSERGAKNRRYGYLCHAAFVSDAVAGVSDAVA